MFRARHVEDRVERDHGRKVAARKIERHRNRTEKGRLRDIPTGTFDLSRRRIHPSHRMRGTISAIATQSRTIRTSARSSPWATLAAARPSRC